MRCNPKKAFTVVELIIVIAVIGVLAAILIPTFSNVIEKANQKSALSDAKNTLTKFLSEKYNDSENGLPDDIVIIIEKAKKFYVYGWSSVMSTDNGLLFPYGNNGEGYAYNSEEELIENIGCTQEEYSQGITNFITYYHAKMMPDYSLFGTTSDGKPNAFYIPARRSIDMTRFDELSNALDNTIESIKIYDGALIPDLSKTAVTFPEGNCGIYYFGGYALSYQIGGALKDVTNLPSIDSVAYGSDYVIPSNIPVGSGTESRFDGYLGSNGAFYQPGDTITGVTDDLLLTATWSVEEYSVFFGTLNAFGTQLNYEYECDFGDFVNGSLVTPANMDALIRSVTVTYQGEGDAPFDFLGWRLESENDDGTIYNADYIGTMIFHEEVHFVPSFNDTYSDVLVGMRDIDGNEYYSQHTLYEGSRITLGTPTEMAEYLENLSGYDIGYVEATDCVFTGWRCEIDNSGYGEEWEFLRNYEIGDTFTVPHALITLGRLRLTAIYTLIP